MSRIYLIPNVERIDESLKLAEKYHACFEYNDFCNPGFLDDEKAVEERIAFYQSLERNRNNDTLHGAYLDITVHSQDSTIREASEHRVRQCMDIAERLGIRGVVFHTNFIPNFRGKEYREHWMLSNERFWRQILKEYPKLSIFMENMFDEEPETLAALAVRMEKEERFGICFDYAHAQIFGEDIENWVVCLGAYTKHMHINDNDLITDLHQSVGTGKLDWKQFTELMNQAQIDSTVLIEVKDLAKQRESLEYMMKNRIYPCL